MHAARGEPPLGRSHGGRYLGVLRAALVANDGRARARRGADPSKYETDLANLIRDLRKDLKAPDMKVVVGTSGMCGFPDQSKYGQGGYQHCAGACATLADPIIPAQLAVGNASKYPEFKGNVASVETRGFHYDMQESAGNQCYHVS